MFQRETLLQTFLDVIKWNRRHMQMFYMSLLLRRVMAAVSLRGIKTQRTRLLSGCWCWSMNAAAAAAAASRHKHQPHVGGDGGDRPLADKSWRNWTVEKYKYVTAQVANSAQFHHRHVAPPVRRFLVNVEAETVDFVSLAREPFFYFYWAGRAYRSSDPMDGFISEK